MNDQRPIPTKSESELNEILFQASEYAGRLEKRLKESQRACEDLKSQVIEGKGQVSELQKELRESHDKIFSLQPRREQITETEAAAEFKSLCMGVEEWVETNLGDAIEAKQLLDNRISNTQISRFLEWVSPAGKQASQYPDTDVYNVTAAILKFLTTEIFQKDFYCPVEPEIIDTMDSVLRSMERLEPRRGKSPSPQNFH